MEKLYKPRVLLVHNFYQIPGGEDTVFNNEKKLLEDSGHKVIIYTRDNKEIEKFNMIEKICYPLKTIFSLKTYNEAKKIISDNQIDIVHAHNTWPLISPALYYAALHSKVPVVQTVHNFRLICPGGILYHNGKIFEESLHVGLRSSIKQKVYKESYIHTFISAATLKIHRIMGTYKKVNYIFLTEFNKKKHLELNTGKHTIINEKKTFIKPNFVNMDRQVLSLAKRKNQFVFVGRLDKLKGIDLLLKAWEQIKDSDLIICGTGPEEEACRESIKKKKLSNVHMKGLVSNSQAMEIIAESRALILPTQLYEGFPMTVVESFAVGTPIIGSNIGNVADLIKDGINGMKFTFNSSENLKDVVLRFNELDEKQLSANAYQTYIKNYSAEVNYRILIDIYANAK